MSLRPDGSDGQDRMLLVCGLLPALAMVAAPWGDPALGFGISCAVAFALLLRPPSRDAMGWLAIPLVLLALSPLLALAPRAMAGSIWWREILSVHWPAADAVTVSPEPLGLLAAFPRHLAGCVWIWWVSGQQTAAKPAQNLLLSAWAIAVAGSVGLCTLRWSSGFWDGPWRETLDAAVGTRNQAAAIAALAVVLSVAAGCSAARRWWVLPGVIPGLAALVVLGSRGGMLAALVGVVVSGLLLGGVGRTGIRRVGVGVAVAAVLALVVGLLAPDLPLAKRLHDDPVQSMSDRFSAQATGWRVLASYWATGCGDGSFEEVAVFHVGGDAAPPLHPESDWLWLTSETGLLAGVAALCLAVGFLWRWVRGPQGPAQAAALGAAATLGTHGFLDVPCHAPLPLLLGVMVLAAGRSGSAGTPRARFLHVAVVAVILLLGSGAAWRLAPAERPLKPGPGIQAREGVGIVEAERWLMFHPLDAGVHEWVALQALQAGDETAWARLRAAALIQMRDPEALRRHSRYAREFDRPGGSDEDVPVGGGTQDAR